MILEGRSRVVRVVVALVVALLIVESGALGVLWFVSRRLDEPILRTGRVYARQSDQIRALFFSDTLRGLMFDSVLGWKYRPGWRDQSTVHNLAGLRGEREYAATPPPGTLRIAAFGDSFVYGNEAVWADSWPALMEQADPSLEVLNYGVGGYGVDQAYLRFLQEGRTYSPSLVLICFTTDDLRRLVNVYRRFISNTELPLFKPRFELTDAGRLELRASPARSLEDYRALLRDPRRVRAAGAHDQWYEPLVYANPLYDVSATVRLASAGWIRVANRYLRPDRIYVGESFNTGSTAFRLQIAVFKAFSGSVRAQGMTPLIVLLPDRASVLARAAGGTAVYTPLTRRLDSLGIQVADAGDAFAGEGGAASPDAWFMPGGHYSREGNRVVARWLAPVVRSASAQGPQP